MVPGRWSRWLRRRKRRARRAGVFSPWTTSAGSSSAVGSTTASGAPLRRPAPPPAPAPRRFPRFSRLSRSPSTRRSSAVRPSDTKSTVYTPNTTGVARYSSLRGEPSIISRTTSAASTDQAKAASDFGVPSLKGHAGTTRVRTWMARATLTPTSETVHAIAAPRMP